MQRFTRRSLGAARSGSLGLATGLASQLVAPDAGLSLCFSLLGTQVRQVLKDNGTEVQIVGHTAQHKQSQQNTAE